MDQLQENISVCIVFHNCRHVLVIAVPCGFWRIDGIIIGSGMSHVRCQVITWSSDDVLWIWHTGTNFSEIYIKQWNIFVKIKSFIYRIWFVFMNIYIFHGVIVTRMRYFILIHSRLNKIACASSWQCNSLVFFLVEMNFTATYHGTSYCTDNILSWACNERNIKRFCFGWASDKGRKTEKEIQMREWEGEITERGCVCVCLYGGWGGGWQWFEAVTVMPCIFILYRVFQSLPTTSAHFYMFVISEWYMDVHLVNWIIFNI